MRRRVALPHAGDSNLGLKADDDLDGWPRADRLGVNDQSAVVELVGFERGRVGLTGVLEHGTSILPARLGLRL